MLRLLPLLLTIGCATRMTTIDSLFSDYSGDRPGAAVAVVRNGMVVFAKGYGLADLEQRMAVTDSTNFRLASVTKQFTAAAIARLASRGVLSYDEPIARWLPSLPAATKPITIRQLLQHTSGLVDYEDLIPATQTEQVSDADVLRLLESEDRTMFTPGSDYRYSNSGYVLLGLIIERASGATLGDFLRSEIFLPPGMKHTQLMDRGVTVIDRAYGYTREGGRWIRRDQSVTSATRGDGAIYSSVADLAKWAASLPADLPTDTVATDDPAVRYAYGWRVGNLSGRDMVWHTGETTSFRNAIVRFPKEGLAVVVLTNRDEGEPLEIAKKLASRM